MYLYSWSLDELKDYLLQIEEKTFRADQIYDWLYQKKVSSFDDMSNLNKELKKKLQDLKLFSLKLKQTLESEDEQTYKFLWELEDKNLVESVLILSKDRRTVCVSTQVGCKGGCVFCASGKKGFFRNLQTEEIIEQVVHIDNFLREKDERVTHVVFMGMGEPLDNFLNVMKSIKILNDPKGMNISQRKITISTVGLIENIKKLLGENLKVNLTLSLHAPNQKIRSEIMPSAKNNDFDELLHLMEEYFENSKRDVTFEYILIDNVNDQKIHARELGEKIKKHFNVNLIAYNPIHGVDFKRPCRNTIEEFKNELEKKGIVVTLRYPKGKDIAAACGQLAFQN